MAQGDYLAKELVGVLCGGFDVANVRVQKFFISNARLRKPLRPVEIENGSMVCDGDNRTRVALGS
jgi:hypothetical protein